MRSAHLGEHASDDGAHRQQQDPGAALTCALKRKRQGLLVLGHGVRFIDAGQCLTCHPQEVNASGRVVTQVRRSEANDAKGRITGNDPGARHVVERPEARPAERRKLPLIDRVIPVGGRWKAVDDHGKGADDGDDVADAEAARRHVEPQGEIVIDAAEGAPPAEGRIDGCGSARGDVVGAGRDAPEQAEGRELVGATATEGRRHVEIHEANASLREWLSPDRGGLVFVAAHGPDDHKSALDHAPCQWQERAHVTDADGRAEDNGGGLSPHRCWAGGHWPRVIHLRAQGRHARLG